MSYKKIITFCVLFLSSTVLYAAEYSLIPKPLRIEPHAGSFTFNARTKLIYFASNANQKFSVEFLANRLKSGTGLEITIQDSTPLPQSNFVLFNYVTDETMGSEGYELDVEADRIFITANGAAGIFYAVQTLLQLLPPEIYSPKPVTGVEWKVSCVTINDKPRFSWRGMHLDVGRHFFPAEFVKKYIDLLAMYKMNMFHWHLTEDQGWRIEIKKYPKLTQIGAWRKETMGDSTRYGGFYTQDEIKEIVEYARQRFITIVPEIEMPGHSLAAITAYPQFSCTGGPFEVGTVWGVFDDVFCAGNDSTFMFLQDVIDEVCSLFPGPFFHIGGDECPKTRWDACPKCQARIKAEGLKDSHELQSYFVKRIEKILNAKGKRLIGWDEILEGGVAPNATIMSWRGIDGGIAAAKAGHDVVMTPTSNCYFDYFQGSQGEPKNVDGFLPIDTVYSYEPVPSTLSSDEAKHILGTQGNVWTERMPTTNQVEYMALPRLCAMSEIGWTSRSRKNFDEFLYRLETHYNRFTAAGYNYYIPTPIGIGGKVIIFHDTLLSIITPVTSATIYYTLDTTEPSLSSLKYDQPIYVKDDQTIKSKLVLENGNVSNTVTTHIFRVNAKTNGVEYSYYEGEWDSLPDYALLKPVSLGRIYDFGLDNVPWREDNFSIVETTNLLIEKQGDYTFFLTSDDGSKLYVDGKLVVNNDGLHGSLEKSGNVNLMNGKHKLRVEMFERTGNQALSLSYDGPGISKQPIPPRLFFVK